MNDALAEWRAVRARVDWDAYVDPSFREGTHDDVLARARPEVREALGVARRSAVLDWSALSLWQRSIVDDTRFRATDAFAKGGRERYGAATIEELASALAEAAHGPILARAARVYLDVAFFHPFVDGNGRAALLALDWVLTRAGLRVRDVRPIVMERWAADPNGPDDLVRLLRVVTSKADRDEHVLRVLV